MPVYYVAVVDADVDAVDAAAAAAAAVPALSDPPSPSPAPSPSPRAFLVHRIENALCLGLEDNWSQLRLASLLAAKTFLLALSGEDREGYWPQLLPPLSLDR